VSDLKFYYFVKRNWDGTYQAQAQDNHEENPYEEDHPAEIEIDCEGNSIAVTYSDPSEAYAAAKRAWRETTSVGYDAEVSLWGPGK